MPTLTEEQAKQLRQDLLGAFQAQFGENWIQNLTKNLRPSPVRELAARYGVSVKAVQKVKQQLWMAGLMLQAAAEGGALDSPPLE